MVVVVNINYSSVILITQVACKFCIFGKHFYYAEVCIVMICWLMQTTRFLFCDTQILFVVS